MSKDLDVCDAQFFIACRHVNHLTTLLKKVQKTVDQYDLQLIQCQRDIDDLKLQNATDIRRFYTKKDSLNEALEKALVTYIFNRSQFRKTVSSLTEEERFELSPESLNDFSVVRKRLITWFLERYKGYLADRPRQLTNAVESWVKVALSSYVEKVLESQNSKPACSFLLTFRKQLRAGFLRINQADKPPVEKASELFALIQEYLPKLELFQGSERHAIKQVLVSPLSGGRGGAEAVFDDKLQKVMSIYRLHYASVISRSYIQELFQQTCGQSDIAKIMSRWNLSRGSKNHIRSFMMCYYQQRLGDSCVDKLVEELFKKAKRRGRFSYSKRFSTIMTDKLCSLRLDLETLRADMGDYDSATFPTFKKCSDFINAHCYEALSDDLSDFLVEQCRVLVQSQYISPTHARLLEDILLFRNQRLDVASGHYESITKIEKVREYLTALKTSSHLTRPWFDNMLALKAYCGSQSSRWADSISKTIPSIITETMVSFPSLGEEQRMGAVLERIEQRKKSITNLQETMVSVEENRLHARREMTRLKELLAQQVFTALNLYVHASKSRGLFSCHGQYGQKVAESLAREIITAETFDDARTRLIVYFQSKPQVRNQSFATFLLRELWAKDTGVLSYFKKDKRHFEQLQAQDFVTSLNQHCEGRYKAQGQTVLSQMQNFVEQSCLLPQEAQRFVGVKCTKQNSTESLQKKSGSFTNWLGYFGCYSKQRKLRRRASHGAVKALSNMTSLPLSSYLAG